LKNHRFLTDFEVFHKQFSWPYNENYGHRKRYQRHIADVSIISDIIISALQIDLQ